MKLSSPSHAVVGTRNLEKTARLLQIFGLEIRARGTLEADVAGALYGLDRPAPEILLAAPGADVGGVCLVQTPSGPVDAGPYDPRPIAVDFYTRDIERSRDIARSEGLHLGELVDYAVGPLQLKEFEAEDDDGLRLVFIEIANRRPSVLDWQPERLHSEVHSIVFAVPDAEASLELWRDVAELDVLVDAPITGPVISQLMGLPRPNVPVRFVLLCDGEIAPARFEILQFVEDAGGPVNTRPLKSGLDGVAFKVPDLDLAMGLLATCDFGPVVSMAESPGASARSIRRAVAGVAPDGIRFELWQP